MRKVWNIHGGVHPAENKHPSNQLPIVSAGIPKQLVFPLSQHIGTPASAIVVVGQKVLKGEMIAAAKGFVSVPVHASTSGEVLAIETRTIPHPSGLSAACIVIKPDGKDQWIEHSGTEDYTSIEKSELLNRIRESGIAGMGGAGFPAAVKLTTRDDQVIETLIINGTECEPYITADDRLMQERALEIIEGTKILQHLINPATETLIGVEDNKPEGIAALKKAAAGSNIEIVSFPTQYPSGGEKQLIQIVTGKEVPSGGLPAQVGVICQNVGTIVAIYRAIKFGEPLISRITTVTGFALEQQRNVEVLLGTPIHHLLTLCGFNERECSRLIIGGPMMGFTLESDDVPVVKTTNCILAPTVNEMPPPSPVQACIRCGMCEQACPVSLLPQQMYWFARGKEYDKLEAHNLMDCIECGACSYACPSNIPLVQYYRASKADIREHKQNATTAEQSKRRFEARKDRIERQQREKDAKRQARKAARAAEGSATGDKTDAIQAAIERAKAKKSALNPAPAAIEKAQAKRAGSAAQTPTKESLEQTLTTIEKRLATAKEKLQQAEQDHADNIDALRTGVEKTVAKYQQAKQALEQFIADNPAAATEPNPKKATTTHPAQLAIEGAPQKSVLAQPTPTGDAAQDAIARALAKRDAASNMTAEERLKNTVDSIGKRLDKTREKLAMAEADGDKNAAILAATAVKLDIKLADAKQAFDAYLHKKGKQN
ncbi:MAG: electron transport complex subunit RsxC [Pseudomonadales bacterium]